MFHQAAIPDDASGAFVRAGGVAAIAVNIDRIRTFNQLANLDVEALEAAGGFRWGSSNSLAEIGGRGRKMGLTNWTH